MQAVPEEKRKNIIRLEYFNPIGGLGWYINKFKKYDSLENESINGQIKFFDKCLVHGANLAAGINFDDMIAYLKKLLYPFVFVTFMLAVALSCVPKEEVVFRGVKNITIETNQQGDPVLKADALFYNPNKERMKLKEIFADVLVNGKPAAQVRQKLNLSIPAASDFSVPVAAQLSLKELGFLDTIVNLLGGKKYDIQYAGFVRISVHGVTIKVPFTYTEQIRLRL